MAPPDKKPRRTPPVAPKLKRLPPHAHISKRPILHPAIPSPYTNAIQPKIIYVSCRTPFISVVKRVRKLLELIDKRSLGQIDLVDKKGSDRERVRKLGKKRDGEEVFLKGTGKAIEKVLGLALFFQGQEDCRVRIKTGSVGVVDDIVEDEELVEGEEGVGRARTDGSGDVIGGGEIQDAEMGKGKDEEELPETQIRRTSVIEVGISLR